MNQVYKEAFSEVEYIINQLEESERAKIPENFRQVITKNKCKWYEVNPDSELKEETLAILAIIYRKFLVSQEEKVELERAYLEEIKKNKIQNTTEIEKKIEYNFLQTQSTSNEVKKEELINIQQLSWYEKLIIKLKDIIKWR